MADAPTAFWLLRYRSPDGAEHHLIERAGATAHVPADWEFLDATTRFTAASLAGPHIGSRMAADAIAEHVGGKEAA